jgi:hypothetical protein
MQPDNETLLHRREDVVAAVASVTRLALATRLTDVVMKELGWTHALLLHWSEQAEISDQALGLRIQRAWCEQQQDSEETERRLVRACELVRAWLCAVAAEMQMLDNAWWFEHHHAVRALVVFHCMTENRFVGRELSRGGASAQHWNWPVPLLATQLTHFTENALGKPADVASKLFEMQQKLDEYRTKRGEVQVNLVALRERVEKADDALPQREEYYRRAPGLFALLEAYTKQVDEIELAIEDARNSKSIEENARSSLLECGKANADHRGLCRHLGMYRASEQQQQQETTTLSLDDRVHSLNFSDQHTTSSHATRLETMLLDKHAWKEKLRAARRLLRRRRRYKRLVKK